MIRRCYANPWSHVAVILLTITLALIWSGQCTPANAQEEVHREYVRVTFYTLPGIMASGQRVHTGAAACSTGFPMGSVLQMPDDWIITCLDRGLLGRGTGWVDIWAPSYQWGRTYVAGDYGDYSWVTVLCWGWCEE